MQPVGETRPRSAPGELQPALTVLGGEVCDPRGRGRGVAGRGGVQQGALHPPEEAGSVCVTGGREGEPGAAAGGGGGGGGGVVGGAIVVSQQDSVGVSAGLGGVRAQLQTVDTVPSHEVRLSQPVIRHQQPGRHHAAHPVRPEPGQTELQPRPRHPRPAPRSEAAVEPAVPGRPALSSEGGAAGGGAGADCDKAGEAGWVLVPAHTVPPHPPQPPGLQHAQCSNYNWNATMHCELTQRRCSRNGKKLRISQIKNTRESFNSYNTDGRKSNQRRKF